MTATKFSDVTWIFQDQFSNCTVNYSEDFFVQDINPTNALSDYYSEWNYK